MNSSLQSQISIPMLSVPMLSIPMLSIIVPCYNVANFVTASLTSIVDTVSAENYTHIEIIIINDGAKDATPQMIEQFIQDVLVPKHIPYQYISQANTGLSQARNNGLAVANADYVYFLDSDDLLVNHAIDKILAVLKEHTPDMIEFDAQTFITEQQLTHPMEDSLYQKYFRAIHNADDNARLLQVFEQFGWYVWARCYKKSLFATHQFEPQRYFEDMMIVPYFYLENRHVISIPEVLIGYRQNPNSITANLSIKHLDDIFFALQKAIEYSKNLDLTPIQQQALSILKSKIWRTIIMVALKQRIYHKDTTFLPRTVGYKKILHQQYGIKEHWHWWYFSGKIGLAVYRKSLKKLGLAPNPNPPK